MKLFAIYFLLLITTSCQSLNTYIKSTYEILHSNNINNNELAYILHQYPADKLIIIDLRPRKDYNQGHITNAVSISSKKLKSITNIQDYQDKKIIIYDNDKISINNIRKKMYHMQLTNFLVLLDGYESWTNFSHKNTNN